MKKFIKGMVKDPERVDQPEATYRDALNANLYIQKGAIVNEQGNKIVADVSPAIVNIIGQCPLEDGRIVLFAIDASGHVISILSPKDQSYEVLYRNNDLNFQPTHTIEATAKVDTQGDILVYFTDNYLVRNTDVNTGISYIDDYNPPRVFNVTQQESSSETVLYNKPEYNIDKLDLFLNAGTIPQFDEVRIEDGGGVVSGTYHLALAYVDENGNNTNYLVTSNAVHLVTAPENTIPTENITGDPMGSQSKKSITWEVTIPAQVNYSHIKPVVIQRLGGGQNQQGSEAAYQLQDVKIPEYTGQPRDMLISFTGLESVATEDINAVVIDHVRYESAKTLVQLNNQLYISNLQSRGDIGYQRFANAIQLDAVTEKIENFDPRYFDVVSLNQGYSFFKRPEGTEDYTLATRFEEFEQIQSRDAVGIAGQENKFNSKVRKGYKDSKLFYKKKSYRRSEVYAFYISFVLKDGTETYAYHIPGREAITFTTLSGDDVSEDQSLQDVEQPLNGILNLSELQESLLDAHLYQVIDTQVLLSEVAQQQVSTSFWENRNEYYPDSADFDVFSTNTTGIAVPSGSIRNENVRHHKMPSNKHDSWKFIGDAGSFSHSDFAPSLYSNETELQKFKMLEDINILGIKLSNIRIPKFILRQVQGYKIYYAKRNQQDKTIVGQSVVVPAAFEGVVSYTQDRELAARSKYHRAWYMYGGIPPDTTSYPYVSRNGSRSYKGIPVFQFHDFNLLKNKHTLSGVTHVDAQSILVMKHYRGGPNIKEDTLTQVKSFYVPEWLSSDIENITDPDASTDIDGIPSSLKIKAFITSVMLAGAYYRPGNLTTSTEFATDGDDAPFFSNLNSVYAIKPKSITYLPGHQNIEITGGTGFHGAKYLYNFAGETNIAIGLESGLPMLDGWAANSEITTSQNRFTWYIPGGYLNSISGSEYNKNYSLTQGFPGVQEYPEGEEKVRLGGWPAVHLVNLCAFKSDVYKSFDEQQLVWTGYYKDLTDINPETGQDESGRVNYFSGAESDEVFGGDTYIGRYSFRSTSLTYGRSRFPWADVPLDQEAGYTGDIDVTAENLGQSYLELIVGDEVAEELMQGNYNSGATYDQMDPDNIPLWSVPEAWRKGNNTPHSTVFYFMCESDDLLGFRHEGDTSVAATVKDSAFFDSSTAHEAIFGGPLYDRTHMDHLLYSTNYSLNQDIRVARPFPKKLNDVTIFPTRTIRSLDDEGSINDKYRFFQALEYKDLPRNRGDIFKLFTLGSILYLHTERSLFVTRGKQELQLGDNTQAYVGSGNIFEQDPDEVLPTTAGYGGCDTQFAALSTRFGQFFVNRRDKRVYMYSESIIEISSLGMEKWFLDNIPYQLEQIGIDLEANGFFVDSPTDHFGFVATYDSKFKRVILTKREKVPTTTFLQLFASNVIVIEDGRLIDKRTDKEVSFDDKTLFAPGGWTVSYYPELQAWASRHSYIPRLYASTPQEYYSLVNFEDVEENQVWEHSNFSVPGSFFGALNNFEFEYIDNTTPGMSKIFSNIYYWADVVSLSPINYQQTYKKTSTGFNSFYVYNTQQISGTPTTINYLSNSRLVDKVWYINDFRDMSKTTTITEELVTGLPNVQEEFGEGVVNALDNVSMFTAEGIVNPSYINENKSWFEQKRFVDHYLGVRLISDNSSNNLIYLYAAGTKHRQSFR